MQNINKYMNSIQIPCTQRNINLNKIYYFLHKVDFKNMIITSDGQISGKLILLITADESACCYTFFEAV